MKVEVIAHESGDLLPLLLGNDDMPIPAPNEFIISRRSLSPNTLVRNLRELLVLYLWLEKEKIDLDSRVRSERSFNEAEIKGGLVEFLKRDHETRRSVKKMVVTPYTFNQRLTTVRQYLAWCCDVVIGTLPNSSSEYEQIIDNKNRLLGLLETSFINAPPTNRSQKKGLNGKEIDFLLSLLNPENKKAYGRDPAVRYRNYILTMIMLYYGLRPGELLSLRVEDVEIGAISSIRVERRSPDPLDTRKPRPQIKRNGRVLPIIDPHFAKNLDTYITEWRDVLEDKSATESNYLILSDEGEPLSQSSVTQLYQLLRKKYAEDLPRHLTAKALRHSFSSHMERILRNSGIEEDKRKQALAYLRGDSSLSSQDVYIAQEVEEQANIALKKYQRDLIMEDVLW
ncbi:site-specific integrase [Thalassomonas actiniarum]|uniref:Site-specific integrase n=1 Tax=Thalassomonas actiniarum TaxID=485447 RepID=A0AAE9YU84_9GAMM|nr:site-specific integrase [Thalassomonas actiniarum]WDD99602.1 site-specific integrase [Thalassomonas actiniarum]